MDQYYVELNELETNEINFDVFSKIVAFCMERELSVASHLDEDLLKKSKGHFKKMDVGIAQKLFSPDTVSSLEYLMEHYPDRFPSYYKTTKLFIAKVARWWEIMKSRTVSFCFHSDSSKTQSEHHKIWKKNYQELKKFIIFIGSIKTHDRHKKLNDFQKASILGTTSVLWLADKLVKTDGFKFFLPGRVLNDTIENFFSQIRQFNKNPSALMFHRFAKALAVTQYLKYSPSGSYGEDDAENFFLDLDDFYHNEVQKDFNEELEDVESLETDEDVIVIEKEDYDPNDFAEDCALAHIAGYVLKKTVGSVKSKCDTCVKVLLVPEKEDKQEVNALIKAKSFKEEKLGFPSILANKMFKSAELVFRQKRIELLKENKNIGPTILEDVLRDFETEFSDIPVCHLRLIFGRFIRIRCHFWAKRSNRVLIASQEGEIEAHANSSASLKQVQVTHN